MACDAAFARADGLTADDVGVREDTTCFDTVVPALRRILDGAWTETPSAPSDGMLPGVYRGTAEYGDEEHHFVIVVHAASMLVLSSYGGERHLFKRTTAPRAWLAAVADADFERAFGIVPLRRAAALLVELRRCEGA